MEEDQPWAGRASPGGQATGPGAVLSSLASGAHCFLTYTLDVYSLRVRGYCCGYSLVFGESWTSRLCRATVLLLLIFLCSEYTRLHSMPMIPRSHSSSWSHGLWADRFQSMLAVLLMMVRLWDLRCCVSLCQQLWSCSTCLMSNGLQGGATAPPLPGPLRTRWPDSANMSISFQDNFEFQKMESIFSIIYTKIM